MRLEIRHDLPFVTITVAYRGATTVVDDVLIDTGSASTLLAADAVGPLGVVPEPSDVLHTLRGVGGREVVFTRTMQCVQVGETVLREFLLEVGGMDYGFAIGGILGMDYLLRVGAVLDLGRRVIEFPSS